MTNMRRLSEPDLFNLHRDGSFGTFTLEKSNQQSIYFVSTIFRLSEIDHLSTAKEVLRDEEIDFEAMIQRDIVPSHVRDIERYLSETRTTGEVRFFPPLLVALLGYREGSLESYYAQPTLPAPEGDEWSVTWGDVFECTFGLPRAGERVRTVTVTPPNELYSGRVEVISYLSTLKLNTDAARLVVVDGQHRLRALKDLAKTESGREVLQHLTVPACIIWPPWAYSTNPEGGPSVKECLRQIFVDVNSKAKQVSGHFSILLRDDHIAAIAIREICEHMRSKGTLHFVEWNQHIETRASQLTWFNKVTSVGILWQALTDSGATRAGNRRDNYIVNRVFPFLLQTEDVREELDRAGDENCNHATITNWERSFTTAQRGILKAQLRAHFAPCAARLFFSLRPFVVMEELITSVFERYLSKDARQYGHAIHLLKSMQEPEESVHEALRRAVHDEVREGIQDIESFSPSIYRTQRFQQGLVSALYWFVDICHRNVPTATPNVIVDSMIRYLNDHVFDGGDRVFRVGSPWLEHLITRGGSTAIVKNQSTRYAVCQLLLSRLGEGAVAAATAATVSDDPEEKGALTAELETVGAEMAAIYIGEYRKAYRASFVSSLEYDEALSEEELGELQAFRSRAKGGDDVYRDLSPEEAETQFFEKVNKLVNARIRPHLVKFSRALGYRPKQLSEMDLIEDGDDNDSPQSTP